MQAIRYFVKDRFLPKERYRNIVKRWGPLCFDKQGVTMIKYKRPNYPTRDLVVAPADRISDIIAESHGSLLGGHDAVEKQHKGFCKIIGSQGFFRNSLFH